MPKAAAERGRAWDSALPVKDRTVFFLPYGVQGTESSLPFSWAGISSSKGGLGLFLPSCLTRTVHQVVLSMQTFPSPTLLDTKRSALSQSGEEGRERMRLCSV